MIRAHAVLVLSLCFAANPASAARWPDDNVIPLISKHHVEPSSRQTGSIPAYPLPVSLRNVQSVRESSAASGLSEAYGWKLLRRNGFAVGVSEIGATLGEASARLDAAGAPLLVTGDTALVLTLNAIRDAEQNVWAGKMSQDLLRLVSALKEKSREQGLYVTGELREACRRNQAYFAVAEQLLSPGRTVTDEVRGDVESELALLASASAFSKSPLMGYDEDYSAYRAPERYASDAGAARLWKARIWLSRPVFAGETGTLAPEHVIRRLTIQAMLIAHALRSLDFAGESGDGLYARLYGAAALLDGFAENPTPADYLASLSELFGEAPSPPSFAEETRLATFRRSAPFRRFRSDPHPLRAVSDSRSAAVDRALQETAGMRFLPPPAGIEADLVAPLTSPSVGAAGESFGGTSGAASRRTLPLLLDLFVALGSSRARALLYETGEDDFAGFDAAVAKSRRAWNLRDSREGTASVRTVLLRALAGCIAPASTGHPAFMTAPAYADRALVSAEAAFVLLRGEVAGTPGAAVAATSARKPSAVYAEPLVSLYTRLWTAVRLLRGGLAEMGYPLTDESRLRSLGDALARLEKLSEAELSDQPLSSDDETFLVAFASARLPGIQEFDTPASRSLPTYGDAASARQRIGTSGPFHALVAVCPFPDGRYVACAGPALSYREALAPNAMPAEPLVPFWSVSFREGAPPPPTPTPSPKKKPSRSLPPAQKG